MSFGEGLGGRLALSIRLARERRWQFLRFTLRNIAGGMTTWHCRQCGGKKGLTASRVCSPCGVRNIWRAIFDDDAEPTPESEAK